MKKTVQIEEQTARRLYPTASPEFKSMLEDSFGKEFFAQKITDRIKSYLDACAELGEEPLNESQLKSLGFTDDEIVYRKIKTITQALNEGWTPDWSDGNQKKREIMIKDMLGNPVKTGDILLELGIGSVRDEEGNCSYMMKLWQKPAENDGSGYEYSIDGTKSRYWWASVENSIVVDMKLMPKGFKYSFLHGMTDLETTIENGTLLDLINNSDWKEYEVLRTQVKKNKVLNRLEINSIEDIENNIDILTGGNIPDKVVSKVFEMCDVERSKVINGEIGIASMCDYFMYYEILNTIRKKRLSDTTKNKRRL